MTIQGTVELWINGRRVRKAKYASKFLRTQLIKSYYYVRESYEDLRDSYILIKPKK